MKRGTIFAGAFAAILAANVFACDGDRKATTVMLTSDKSAEETTSLVLAGLPHIEFRIGEKTTSCGESAKHMAASSKESIIYVVAEKTFESKGEAITQLTSLLEKEVETLKSMQYVAAGGCGSCPHSAKSAAKKVGGKVTYRVAGVDFADKATAQAVLASFPGIVESVKMEYKVDGKKYGCSKTAGAKCKKAGKEMTYVIGTQETNCQTTAKMMLMETLVRKLVETAVDAQIKA